MEAPLQPLIDIILGGDLYAPDVIGRAELGWLKGLTSRHCFTRFPYLSLFEICVETDSLSSEPLIFCPHGPSKDQQAGGFIGCRYTPVACALRGHEKTTPGGPKPRPGHDL